MSLHDLFLGIVKDLATRGRPGRTEADVQAGLKAFLLAAPLNLEEGELDVRLELQSGGRRRIDVEAGQCVFEVKKDLTVGKVLDEAVEQLAGYVRQRTELLGQRYVGVLTDGAAWHLYHSRENELHFVTSIQVDATSPDVEALSIWVESRRYSPPRETVDLEALAGERNNALEEVRLAHDRASVAMERCSRSSR